MKFKFSKNKFFIAATMVAVFGLLPVFGHAEVIVPRAALAKIYRSRPDLQKVFDAYTWQAKQKNFRKILPDLETWARRYGWKENPKLLSAYEPKPTEIKKDSINLKFLKRSAFPDALITAESFIVIDQETKTVIASRKPDLVWPMASLTKLTTAIVALKQKSNNIRTATIESEDSVGGGELRVPNGTELSFEDIIASMLIGSANNSANVLARITSGNRSSFVAAMNTEARRMGLVSTFFADPSGIEVGNTSTARELATVAQMAFTEPLIKELTTQSQWKIQPEKGEVHLIKNTDKLITDPQYNDLYVTGSKTGYIDEAKWNLIVSLKPKQGKQKELLIVALGSGNRDQSFKDVATLARWTWKNFSWN